MGEIFWKALLLTLPHHHNIIKDIPILKDLPIPDGFKAIILLACLGIIIFAFRGRKEEAQKLPIKKTLPQPTAQSKNVPKLGTGKVPRERILCLDESCTGTIGDDGCCGYCGKSLTQPETNKALKMRLDDQRKYQPVNDNPQAILESIPQSHIDDYDYLIQNRNQVADPRYQQKYKTFYRLFGAGLSPDYCNEYFTLLRLNLNDLTSLRDVVNYLYEIPCNNRGKKLQFSFSSKLIHTVNPHSPIYDSNIVRFYSFSEPKITNTIYEQRILKLLTFHEWLCDEYERVLKNGILIQAIQQFRDRFKPTTFTDEKVIDSLIWGFEKWRKPKELDK